MKVIVNNEEHYEVKIPDEMPLAQVDLLIARLSKLRKLFGRDIFDIPKKQRVAGFSNPTSKRWHYTKEQMIEILRIYYNQSIPKAEKRITIEKMTNNDYKAFQTKIWSWKKKFGITPKDVGLAQW